MRKNLLLFATAALALSPAAAQQLHYLDPRDVAEAQRDNAALIRELGGTETGPKAAYVDSVGHRVAAFAGIANPRQELHFVALNSAVENAFSVPGGYVYITRQLMTLMDDESELAFALGHEAGHIAANHAHIREQYAQQSGPGIFGQIIGAIFGSEVARMMTARSTLDLLSFSREQEYEADTLGMRYMVAAGYDPAGAPELLAALTRGSALQALVQGRTNRQLPEWASTHPLSENRMQRALAEAQASGRLGRGERNRDQFLSEIEGLYVGDDPAQGVIEGPTFTHPDLRIQFTVPQGYLMSNGTDAVTISGSAGKAQFREGPPNLDQSISFAFRLLTRDQFEVRYPTPQRLRINGMLAAVTTAHVQTDSGLIDASVVAYQWNPQRVFYFVILTPGGYGVRPFVPMINSLRRITPAEAAAIKPRIIHVVTVKAGDTIQGLAGQMAYRTYKVERFLSLNGLAPNSRLLPGQRVKVVVYAARRG